MRYYKLFLFKLFTLPNESGLKSQVFSTYLVVSLLQGVNVATIYFFLNFFGAPDIKNLNKFLIGGLVFLPPLLANYYLVYRGKGYKKILNEFVKERKGNILLFFSYLFITILIFLFGAYLTFAK